ncbi:MAG: polyprenyl synthetase family protein [Prevotellaceae bacterium]|jgi:octaprenyl-diphosphate synthase|nr:polyprenyl synthetase family protein [Prevotellaceae bacterium]
MELNTAKNFLGNNWTAFENFYRSALRSDIAFLNTINDYLLQHSGKQLRPLLTLIAAKLCGEITASAYVAAAAVEMVHTASLLHDDVVDNADWRHGMPTVKTLWKSQAAVLTGDYWLSRAFQLVVEHQEHRLLPTFTSCLLNLSEGELFQMSKAQILDTTQDDYYTIIGKKTASLMSAGMKAGAITGGGSKLDILNMNIAGYALGLAFQIRDDIFDYTKNNFFDKPTGIDLREQKITLPLICALKNVENNKREEIIREVKKAAKNSRSAAKVTTFVRQQGGIETAQSIQQEHINEAIAIFLSYPESEICRLLINIARYLAKRDA